MSTSASPEVATKHVPDVRGFWRVLLAVVLPLPWLAKGIQYAIQPVSDGTAAEIRSFMTDQSYAWLQWFGTVFVILVVPSAATLAWLSRRAAPRLATAGGLLTATGFLAGVSSSINGDQLAWIAAQKQYDPAVISRLSDDLEANPTAGLGGGLFILGLVIGSLLLALALWRSNAVRPWAALAIGVGGCTHPFLQSNHVVVGIGLAVLAAGCAAASVALLRMPNDEFDLPPTTSHQPTDSTVQVPALPIGEGT